MWNSLSRFIIRYRVPIIIVFVAITGFMLHSANEARMTYSLPKILPEDDVIYLDYLAFQEKYGERNIMVIAIQDDSLQDLNHFKDLAKTVDKIKNISGVEQVLSITELPLLYKDTLIKKFKTKLWYDSLITSQEELDIAFTSFLAQPFYKGLLMNEQNKVVAIIIKLNYKVLLTPKRDELISSIKKNHS